MAAAMNGIALHGGLIPYGGTFMSFSDYCRPAIRLASMMDIRTIFVMTHDSSDSARTARRISRSSICRPYAPSHISPSTGRVTRWRRRSAGKASWTPHAGRRCWRCPVSRCRCCAGNGGTENRSARGGYVLFEAEGGPRS